MIKSVVLSHLNLFSVLVDSGYGLHHPDLPVNGVTGTDTSVGTALFDGNSHGTHVAGTIGATGNDGGVIGGQ